mgnify:CR=1 FL=1
MKLRFGPTKFWEKSYANHDGDTPGAQFGHETAENDRIPKMAKSSTTLGANEGGEAMIAFPVVPFGSILLRY